MCLKKLIKRWGGSPFGADSGHWGPLIDTDGRNPATPKKPCDDPTAKTNKQFVFFTWFQFGANGFWPGPWRAGRRKLSSMREASEGLLAGCAFSSFGSNLRFGESQNYFGVVVSTTNQVQDWNLKGCFDSLGAGFGWGAS